MAFYNHSGKTPDNRTKDELNKGGRFKGVVTPLTTGAVGELEVSVDMMRNGFEVFRSHSPNTSCDLIALLDGKCFRIEVKVRRYRTCSESVYQDGKSDIVAVVDYYGSIEYYDVTDGIKLSEMVETQKDKIRSELRKCGAK